MDANFGGGVWIFLQEETKGGWGMDIRDWEIGNWGDFQSGALAGERNLFKSGAWAGERWREAPSFSPFAIDSKPPHGFSPFGHVAFAPVQTTYKPSVVL